MLSTSLGMIGSSRERERGTGGVSSSSPSPSWLGSDLLAQLPSGPEDMIHAAHQITLYAFNGRVTQLEKENQALRASFAKSQTHTSTVERRCVELERELVETQERLRSALEERDGLAGERTALISTVKRLNRDISKADTFKISMMKALQEETSHIPPSSNLLLKNSPADEEYSSHLPYGGALGVGHEDSSSRIRLHPDQPHHHHHPSSPPGTAPTTSSSASQWTSRPLTTNTSHFPTSSSHRSDGNTSPLRKEPNGRVDGKEFFRQARARMPQENFSKFLLNIKDLNGHKKSHEEALKTAQDLFGPDNHELYEAFEAMIGRHLP